MGHFPKPLRCPPISRIRCRPFLWANSGMQLKALLSATQIKSVDGSTEREITSLAYDSRRIQPGGLFVALKGEKVDGAQFVAQAVEKGAEAIMSPIHHHFELKGWKENTVIVRFWILSVMFALLGLATLKLR